MVTVIGWGRTKELRNSCRYSEVGALDSHISLKGGEELRNSVDFHNLERSQDPSDYKCSISSNLLVGDSCLSGK